MQTAGITFTARAEDDNSYLLRFLFALFVAVVLARLFVTATVVDLFENYTTLEGSFIEKIHPANYGTAVVALVVLLTFRIELSAWELRVVRAFIGFIAYIAIYALAFATIWPSGRSTSAGYLVDSYVFACISGALMFAFPKPWRELVGNSILIVLVVSAVIAVGELVAKQRLLPYPDIEATFRPTGLLGHPLTIGTCTVMAIAFVTVTRWPSLAKAFAIVLLLLGAFAANARLGTIVATGATLLIALWTRYPSMSRERQLQLKLLIVIAAVLAIPLLIAGLFALGFGERLFEKSLFDESAMARVSIYRVFDLVSWHDILFGSDIEAVHRLAVERFDLEFIESPFVIFIFQFGLIGALVFLLFLARTFIALLAGAQRNVVLGACAFLLVALGNNTLASKTPTIEMLFLLIIAFHPPLRTRRRAGLEVAGR